MATSFTICRLAVSGPANGKGFSEFSGLRNSSIGYLSFSSRKSSEDFHSVIAFQTSAVGGREGNTKGVVEAKLKVAINGFGRIGRNFLRCWNGRKDSPLHIIAINDTTGGVKQASQASLSQGLGNRLLIEGTGVFVDRDGAGKHIQAGAKKILITAPGKGDIPTYVVGVNAGIYDPDEPIISNASSTLRQVKLYIGYISCVPRIETRDMRLPNTTHSYGDQRLLDVSHRNLRHARAAVLNIVPTSSGAAKAVALVLPTLKGPRCSSLQKCILQTKLFLSFSYSKIVEWTSKFEVPRADRLHILDHIRPKLQAVVSGKWSPPLFLVYNFPHIVALIEEISIPVVHNCDKLVWKESISGDLSLKDSYLFMFPSFVVIKWQIWNWLFSKLNCAIDYSSLHSLISISDLNGDSQVQDVIIAAITFSFYRIWSRRNYSLSDFNTLKQFSIIGHPRKADNIKQV
ncbi:Glyceraldehyde-3-phosphate dehydrogenase A, chloroplastic [Glycine soja]|uniref:Glyceraldehyde-3-phosphate dehydrogenase A, chloroplastic n=1 Tax=Glycine soja TaxID=3848 RepID=A0A445LKH3_GLYSO|nr:Glyceraldehyde-3-phosphate dehydrogenase A, chloroplastic [Glycine soja]